MSFWMFIVDAVKRMGFAALGLILFGLGFYIAISNHPIIGAIISLFGMAMIAHLRTQWKSEGT